MLAQLSSSVPQARIERLKLYRLLADVDRLRILALCAQEPLAVGELCELMKESQPNVSRKVTALREGGLLEGRRDGTRLWLKLTEEAQRDAVVLDAIEEGRGYCLRDGSLAALPTVVAAREIRGQEVFDAEALVSNEPNSAWKAHAFGLAPLLPGRRLAIDAGTGDGAVLDVLAPLFERIIAVDRSPAQLARCAAMVAKRGYPHVSLMQAAFDDRALLERVMPSGGADLVYASRSLHHASRPQEVLKALSRLLRPGGHLIIVDYMPHEDEAMRESQGDAWLGLSLNDLSQWAQGLDLRVLSSAVVPPAFHVGGPDAHLEWFSWVAEKKSTSLTSKT